MNAKDLIFDLISSTGVSGDEFPASETAEKELCKFCETEIDHFGNVIGCRGKIDDKKATLLLDAHIDEIGFIVTYITDDGFLKVSNCGGIDRRLLLAQQVTIFGKEKITGIITSTPPHLEEDDKKVPKIDDIYIDTGLSKEECEKIVSLGDRVIIANKPISLQGDRISGKSLDDRCGVAVILRALELVKDKNLPVNVVVCFSAQEETGERGAKISAFKIQPDFAVAIDVSFALTADDKEYKCGKLGQGPMIGIAPSLSKEFSNRLVDLAKSEEIPFQLEVMNGETGTNADCIGVTGKGVKTVTLSVPLKYMHTPVEVISIEDIENSAKLVAKLLERGVYADA
ncbi:MAG: M42 family metallopeptidase [Ruminococcus sp.]|nr:M42 family metallopeptidase [Ruminococcus sp.]